MISDHNDDYQMVDVEIKRKRYKFLNYSRFEKVFSFQNYDYTNFNSLILGERGTLKVTWNILSFVKNLKKYRYFKHEYRLVITNFPFKILKALEIQSIKKNRE